MHKLKRHITIQRNTNFERGFLTRGSYIYLDIDKEKKHRDTLIKERLCFILTIMSQKYLVLTRHYNNIAKDVVVSKSII